MKLDRAGAFVLIAGALAGFFLVAQQQKAPAPALQRAQELSGEVLRLEEENIALLERVGELSLQIAALESASGDADLLDEQMRLSLESARMEAGLVAVAGPGIAVEIDNLVVPATEQVLKVVQDEDLLVIVNELYAAGAEAVAINGERLIAISEIRAAGNLINVNTRAQSAPFRIEAIGDPQTLLAAMHLRGGILDTFSQIARIQAEAADELTIPAYRGTVAFSYARPGHD